MTAQAKKRRKSKKERDILWYVVKDLILKDPHITDANISEYVYNRFGYELQDWLLCEARFVYRQKVKRGEFPPVGGYAEVADAQSLFMRLSPPDRAKFLDWAQFTLTAQQQN